MFVLSCLPQDFDAATGECAAPFYSEMSASVFAGWTVADIGAVLGAVLTALAIAYILRLLHNFASQL